MEEQEIQLVISVEQLYKLLMVLKNRLNMNNSGDFMTISDPSGTPILTFDIEPLSNNPNESYTRNPDLTGEFEQHSGIQSSGGRLFSPGTKLDGTPFN